MDLQERIEARKREREREKLEALRGDDAKGSPDMSVVEVTRPAPAAARGHEDSVSKMTPAEVQNEIFWREFQSISVFVRWELTILVLAGLLCIALAVKALFVGPAEDIPITLGLGALVLFLAKYTFRWAVRESTQRKNQEQDATVGSVEDAVENTFHRVEWEHTPKAGDASAQRGWSSSSKEETGQSSRRWMAKLLLWIGLPASAFSLGMLIAKQSPENVTYGVLSLALVVGGLVLAPRRD